MDLNTDLTQALSDGTNTYVYGNGRIAQVNTGAEYFLGDALGSVRQLMNASGAITYARAYDPYGVVTTTTGVSSTAYGYTSEYSSQGLVYLRARYYSPQSGRFLSRDTWDGDANVPMSYNAWLYTYGNPINYTDPTGRCPQGWIQNPNGTCSFPLFPFLPGGPVITVPDWLSGLFCGDQTSIFQQPYTTPTVTPQPYTSTPGSVVITPTPIQTQVYGTPTQTLTPTPTKEPLKKTHCFGNRRLSWHIFS